jgi:hypothetical protein
MMNPRLPGLKPLEFAELDGGAEALSFDIRHSERNFPRECARELGGSNVYTGLCSSRVGPNCSPPPVNTNFNVRILPATP